MIRLSWIYQGPSDQFILYEPKAFIDITHFVRTLRIEMHNSQNIIFTKYWRAGSPKNFFSMSHTACNACLKNVSFANWINWLILLKKSCFIEQFIHESGWTRVDIKIFTKTLIYFSPKTILVRLQVIWIVIHYDIIFMIQPLSLFTIILKKCSKYS